MKILLSWLNEYAPFGDDVDALSVALNECGLAVDGIEHLGAAVPGVITAKVLRTERHPDAAKVHRVFVDAGDGVERHVWCGAFNMSAGDVIPLATAGTVMPDGRLIEPRPILGIESQGMLCSARELDLGDDHSGILILPADTPLGLPYADALQLRPDVLFDLDLTRNRPDCWGHLGVARDLAAYLDLPFTPPPSVLDASGAERAVTVEIVDGERCGRFTATVISGIEVQPSAGWMAERLLRAGMRPINNVVDVSNYVMLELNQPNHAYDMSSLGGGGFRIRCAAEGETITTLDGVERSLSAADLLICDAQDAPIGGVAGVMGGLHSEITDATTTVALEIAWFEPVGIMQTAQRLGLRSEASARFERGVDPYGIDASIARFAELLRETCPDLVVHAGAADARGAGLPSSHRSTTVRLSEVNRILGTSLVVDDIAPLIDPIGYTVSAGPAADSLTVALPSWRPDSTAEIDVIEEIARHHGYDAIGKTVPKSTVHGALSPMQQRRRLVRQVLLGLGASEAMPNPFLAPDDIAKAGLAGDGITITNPLVAEESVLRTSLRPGLLKAIGYNESHRRAGVALYEIGHVYPPSNHQLPAEYESLAVVLAGREAPAAVAVWREIAAALGVGARIDQGKVPTGMHPGRSASLQAGKDVVGVVGEIHPDVLDAYGITQRVALVEVNLEVLLARIPSPAQWKPTSRYPSSDIDLAFVVADSVPAEKIDKAIRQGSGNLLVDLVLFDVYRGAGVPDGSRSLAYRLRLQAADRTLTDAEVSELRDRCIAAAAKTGATLR